MDHLTLDEYWEALRGKRPFSQLARQAHEHLVDTCPTCGEAWRDGRGAPTAAGPEARDDQVPPALPEDDRAVGLQDLERVERVLAQSREVARRAREDLKLLLAMPRKERRRRVERARTRMRSRAFVELLVAAAQERMGDSPGEAAHLASLVLPALDRRKGRIELDWARELLQRAEACRDGAPASGD